MLAGRKQLFPCFGRVLIFRNAPSLGKFSYTAFEPALVGSGISLSWWFPHIGRYGAPGVDFLRIVSILPAF